MVSREITIRNEGGLHLRPAGQVCEKAVSYDSKVQMLIGDNQYNLKSVLSVLSARITRPSVITLVCEGPDEEEALEGVGELLGQNLE